MKLSDSISFVLMALALGFLGLMVQMFLPGASILVLSEFCLVLAFSILVVGTVSLLTGCPPCSFSGKVVFKGMLLPLLYVFIGIILTELFMGGSGRSVIMSLLDWIGFFFVLGMCFCIGCKCCKKK